MESWVFLFTSIINMAVAVINLSVTLLHLRKRRRVAPFRRRKRL